MKLLLLLALSALAQADCLDNKGSDCVGRAVTFTAAEIKLATYIVQAKTHSQVDLMTCVSTCANVATDSAHRVQYWLYLAKLRECGGDSVGAKDALNIALKIASSGDGTDAEKKMFAYITKLSVDDLYNTFINPKTTSKGCP